MDSTTRLMHPDYDHSILNIIATIEHYYQLDSPYKDLSQLKLYLDAKPQNILLVIMDGMGAEIIKHHLEPSDFLTSHTKDILSSVYPCTTTAAMTTYYTGLPPITHGWLGWSLFFKEYNRCVDAFINTDTYSKDEVGQVDAARTLLKHPTVFDKINHSETLDVTTYTINPEGITVADEPNINYPCENLKDFSNNILHALSQDGPKYVFAYWYEPDLSIHKTGCNSDLTRDTIKGINRRMAYVADQMPKDTVMIVCADHGLTDIDETLYLNDYPKIMDTLIMPPFIEPRALSFYVKEHKKAQFESLFKLHFGESFMLLDRDTFLSGAYLGKSSDTPHPKVDDFIGNYIAIGTGQKLLKYRTMNLNGEHDFKAHHAGLRPEEMSVPLIIISK